MGGPAERERAYGEPTRVAGLFRLPSRAYARALNLREYVAAGVRLDGPVLDLGCGDGRFALALVHAEVMPPPVASVDHDRRLVHQARRNGMRGAICADLRRLPIRTGVLAGVVSNFVLSSIHAARAEEGDAAGRALAEVRRVLRPGGRFVCALATPRAPENLLGTALLRRLGARGLAARYVRWSNRRSDETLLLAAGAWEERLRSAGFQAERDPLLLHTGSGPMARRAVPARRPRARRRGGRPAAPEGRRPGGARGPRRAAPRGATPDPPSWSRLVAA